MTPALHHVQQAVALAQQVDDRDKEANAHLTLAWIYQRLGDYKVAQHQYAHNLDIRRDIGDRYGEATALESFRLDCL